MTTNTHNRLCMVCGKPATFECHAAPKPVVAPPADEVGRAVERLKKIADAYPGDPTYMVNAVRVADLRLILSERAETRDALKLAVEALEPFAKAADDAEEGVDPASAFRDDEWLCRVDDELTIGDVRRAREALRSIRSSLKTLPDTNSGGEG